MVSLMHGGSTDGAAPRISVEGVSKQFTDTVGQAFIALDNVDLRLAEGEFVSLIGPSGCGKSTLLEIVAGLQTATSGRVLQDGKEISRPGPERAVVFQNYALFPWRTVIDNVAFSMELRKVGRSERREKSGHYLELMGLRGFESHYIWQLSGGMRQRVGLARALACEPAVLLMDEPFGALDAITRDVLQDHLLRIQAETKKTVLFVTHGVDEALYLSDRIVVLGTRPGRVVEIFDTDFDRTRGREHIRSLPEYQAAHAAIWDILSAEMAKERATDDEQPDQSVAGVRR